VDDIIRSNPAVVVVDSSLAVSAMKRATSTIPIVIAVAADPVGLGLVSSLAHPGGNVTGLSMMMPDLVSKRLQLLHEFFPRLKRLGVLRDPSLAWHTRLVEDLVDSAKPMAIEVTVVSAERPADFDGAFDALRRDRVQALYVVENAFYGSQRKTVIGLATQARLPVTYGARRWSEEGALFSYSADFSEMFRRAAGYVDKILKGAKPGDLPIEQPRKFELVINLKTAQALGVKVPESILVQADEVVR
jgi:putative ABC transport system substrate-binding protein